MVPNSYSNTGLQPSTTYYYIVRAADSVGESGNSNRAHAKTLAGGGGLSCHITYVDQNDWGSGFTGAVSIKNTGNQPINGWTLTWTWAGNQHIIQSWNSNYTQSGQNVTLTNAAWNGTINAGATLTRDRVQREL